MNLIHVESSMIAATGYDSESCILVVLFNSGKTYEYYEVPPKIYEGLMAAKSKGSYMRAYVIDNFADSPFRGWKRK